MKKRRKPETITAFTGVEVWVALKETYPDRFAGCDLTRAVRIEITKDGIHRITQEQA